jgi:CelD/BcsL family acetyltransferase involved in cellulose biosynthesis
MKVLEIDSFNDFLALKDYWNTFLAGCDHSIFSTWEWLTVWWRHFGSDKRLLLLTAEDKGKTLGMAPLMYSVHKMFGVRQGKIEFIGTPDSDYNDFIVADQPLACIDLFVRHLNGISEKWNCIELSEIPEHARSLRALNKISNTLEKVHECPRALLPKTYKAFLHCLSHNLRYNLRRSLRRLEKDGVRWKVYDCSQGDSCSEGMRAFFELHQKRWASKRFPGVFAEERFRDFHLDIARVLAEKNWLGLYLLRISDKPVAAWYGFKYQLRYYYYLSGFDPEYHRYGLGNLLLAHIIDQCIQEGLVEFDFLRGGEGYKARWNTVSRWNYKALILKTGLFSNLRNHLYTLHWSQGDRLRRLKYLLKI